MKLIIALILLLPITVHCQTPPTNNEQSRSNFGTNNELHAALDTFHDRQLAATLAEFDDDNRGAWMNYIPGVSIGYALAPDAEGKISSRPRPSVSFSLAQVFAARRQRRERAAKRRSIEASATLAREQAHRELDGMLQRYEWMKLELETMRQVFAIDLQLYDLYRAEYDDARLSPLEFLPKEKAMLEQRLGLERKEMEIRRLEGEIIRFAVF